MATEINGLSSKGQIKRVQVADSLSCTNIIFPEKITTVDAAPVHPLSKKELTY